ncbi:2-amino-4-hydroxy-6-hydroxymethyldihydropteridine diphosphokinase [Vibrio rumoiensis]|uniref:2-amino-4-hydroxy-6-hydroxymethyldihydropteridine diphosphokinase n=1 Tax=Vibrio rumoiensis 1S-45 TaxID=1188252 RepID=A0A1E5E220_9VIBR|nr:2-amino-4-hydroxy-6-hydroxymethyldihydropteridine diphosphokinase [Vibrio rumoiensis]OEF25469.1 2-amino-4-hydroxy-6-hydroxymethyldihydropteridine diphosphokinase [Vibrio rumoiensis 1S-45]
MTLAYIGVGSNLERESHIQAAYHEVVKLGSVKASSVFECQPVGFDSHAFYNLVFELKTHLSLVELQKQLKAIELKWGRSVDAQKFQDRTLDLDILLFGDQVSDCDPVLPRSDIFKYEFVLEPLFELCPDHVIPNDGRSIKQVWQSFEAKGSLTKIKFIFK